MAVNPPAAPQPPTAPPGVPSAPMWRHPEFARGAREMSGAAMGIAAWGLITGVAMAQSGLDLALVLLMSLLVYAGSAQLAVLPLLASGAPVWVVWATALCINLRFVIFSASWRPYVIGYSRPRRLWMGYFMADLNYVMFLLRFPEPKPAPEQLPYFWGGAITNWLSWHIPSLLGIVLADRIPAHWGIGFAGTLALLAVAASLFNGRATLVAAGVAACAAVAAYSLPLKLNIVVAIAAAVAMALMMDHGTRRRARGAA